MSASLRLPLLFLVLELLVGSSPAQAQTAPPATFTNPLLPRGADPWTIYHRGYYYYTHTTGGNITLWKVRSLTELATTPGQVVWTPPAAGGNAHNIWAPELHYLRRKWYLYYAADSGSNRSHRLWVLENSSPDPLTGTWVSKGQITDATNKWAIDGSVFKHRGRLYWVWSGWEGDTNGQQNIYIARLKNPWTVKGPRTRISTPEYAWERNGDLNDPHNPPHVDVNEGPQLLRRGRRLFLVYSASGCWTDSYALGMLSATAGANLLRASAWTKSAKPVFRQDSVAGVYAPGHNSFFTSPDGRQSWLLYHANSAPRQGCGNLRSPRMQPFTWQADGTPYFGNPVPTSQPLPRPSGE
ncbi:glycoside hydrolase family 43 protein [Hymenobacter sp. BT635]|uniref:Glycoside hydrolase family 43 protein n=1 Tax=Hymenobacter nitidus TaxID=2880929 RepID=A0ABS8AIK1_9BACT|nr:glycoside hydrolase family 43 protein [Hymenobacter nitidus]MCB2379070.1 glycoside hydrolase family 43 protein [Hymenobacter nitidus]